MLAHIGKLRYRMYILRVMRKENTEAWSHTIRKLGLVG